MHLQVDSCESCLNMLDQCLLRVSFLNYQLPGFRGENAPPLENKELDEFVPEVGIKEASYIYNFLRIYLRQVIFI